MSRLVREARLAAERGDWHDAYDLLVEADRTAPLSGPDLTLLAAMAYACGNLNATIAAWERAHTQALEAGDRMGAAGAAVRVAMHLLFDTGLMAPVRGWLARGERLLEGAQECPAFAWLAVVRAYERLLSGDLEEGLSWAARAVDVGSRHDPAAEALGRVADARLRIFRGDVEAGLDLLNEAAVATVSGELDPLTTGVVYCEVVCALQGLAQYDMAEEWTLAMETWRQGQPVGSIHGRCRVHRAEILRLRGSADEAQREAEHAYEELRPYLHRELGWPLTEIGRIRLRRGDLAGAEAAFEEADQRGWDPQPDLALLHLARGDAGLAAHSIRDVLERPRWVPSKELPPNTDLRRAPLLEAQVKIELAAGHPERARAAALELAEIARRYQSRALEASAQLARGRVEAADGRLVAGRRHAEGALALWSAIGAPYEAAEAREELERMRLLPHPEDEDASPPEPRPGSPGPGAGGPSPSLFLKETDHWVITFDGRTLRLRDLKGLGYLAHLIAYPGRIVHALALGMTHPPADRRAGAGTDPTERDSGPALDREAVTAYRRRMEEIEEDLALAEEVLDPDRTAQALAERDILARELARAVGMGGRERRTGSASERARSRVTQALRRAIARIGEHHPSLGDHLTHAVRTGTYCAYAPDPTSQHVWRVRQEPP